MKIKYIIRHPYENNHICLNFTFTHNHIPTATMKHIVYLYMVYLHRNIVNLISFATPHVNLFLKGLHQNAVFT